MSQSNTNTNMEQMKITKDSMIIIRDAELIKKELKENYVVLAQWQSGKEEPEYCGQIQGYQEDGSWKVKFKDGDIRLFCPIEDISALIGTVVADINSNGNYKVKFLTHEKFEESLDPFHCDRKFSRRLSGFSQNPVEVSSDKCKIYFSSEADEQQTETLLDEDEERRTKDELLYSFDAVMVLKKGSSKEEVNEVIQERHGRPYGVRCLLDIEEADYEENRLINDIEKTLVDIGVLNEITDLDEGLEKRRKNNKKEEVINILTGKDLRRMDEDKLAKCKPANGRHVQILIGYLNKEDRDKVFQELEKNKKCINLATIKKVEVRTMTYNEFYNEQSAWLIDRIKKAGIESYVFLSPYGKHGEYNYCMLGLSEKRLKTEAQRNKYLLRLNAERAHGKAGGSSISEGLSPLHNFTDVYKQPGMKSIPLWKALTPTKKGSYMAPTGIQTGDSILITVIRPPNGEFQEIKFVNSSGDIIFSFKPDHENTQVILNKYYNGNPGDEIDIPDAKFLNQYTKVHLCFKKLATTFEVVVLDHKFCEFDYRQKKIVLGESYYTIREIRISKHKESVKAIKVRRGNSDRIGLDDWKMYVTYVPQDDDNDMVYERYKRSFCYPINSENSKKKIDTMFSDTDRTKLLISCLEEKPVNSGAGLDMDKYLEDDYWPCQSFYSLHNKNELEKVKDIMGTRQWITGFVENNHLTTIQSYFGEQIAFYYSFMALYTKALYLPALLGIAVWGWQEYKQTHNVPILPVFAIGNVIWAAIFMELWKRKQSMLRIKWGMVHFKSREKQRPSFSGNCRISAVDGREEEYVHGGKRCRNIFFSQSIILSMGAIVILTISGIFIFRSYLIHTGINREYAVYTCSILAAIQIKVYNIIYDYLARWLTDNVENHKTDTDYYNSLIFKTFLFKCINSYKTIMYTAFIQEYDVGCGDEECMVVLRKHLLGLFLSSIIGSMFLGLLKPYWMINIMKRKFTKIAEIQKDSTESETSPLARDERKDREETSELETVNRLPNTRSTEAQKQHLKADFDNTFEDFDQIVIRYGYLSLFVVALPLMPALALLSQFYETAVDSHWLCTYFKRPEPRSAADIGAWGDILSLIGYIAVLTNVACLYTEWGGERTMKKVLVFLFMEHLLIILNGIIAYCINDEDQVTAIMKERRAFVEKELILGQHEKSIKAVTQHKTESPVLSTKKLISNYYDCKKLKKGVMVTSKELTDVH